MNRYCWTRYGMLKTNEPGGSYYRHEVTERMEKERDFWKAKLIAELEEVFSDKQVENEIYEHERALQHTLTEPVYGK